MMVVAILVLLLMENICVQQLQYQTQVDDEMSADCFQHSPEPLVSGRQAGRQLFMLLQPDLSLCRASCESLLPSAGCQLLRHHCTGDFQSSNSFGMTLLRERRP